MSQFNPLPLAVVKKGFEIYLLFLLTGYAIFDKGFAYLGIGLVYVSEIGLMLGLSGSGLMLFSANIPIQKLRTPIVTLMFAFLSWQGIILALNIRHYGIDALRDSAVWIYAAYALFILIFFSRDFIDKLATGHFDK